MLLLHDFDAFQEKLAVVEIEFGEIWVNRAVMALLVQFSFVGRRVAS